jgi:peptidyl-prolyl cis-trans isomerase C
MFKNKLLISSLLIALSTPVLAEIDKTVIANVNGKDVIAEELIMTATQNKIDYAVLNDMQKRMLLNGLINRMLVAEEARKQSMMNDPETKLKIEALIDSVLAATLLEKETKNVKISDVEIQTYYDKNIKTNIQKQYKARHILVKEENVAKELASQLSSSDADKFAAIAKEKSIDTGSAANGGDLGWFNPVKMVPSFAKAVQEATKGIVTAPVKSQFGWHLILVEDSKDATPPTLADSKVKIQQLLTKEKISAYLDGLEKKAKIDIKLGK